MLEAWREMMSGRSDAVARVNQCGRGRQEACVRSEVKTNVGATAMQFFAAKIQSGTF